MTALDLTTWGERELCVLAIGVLCGALAGMAFSYLARG